MEQEDISTLCYKLITQKERTLLLRKICKILDTSPNNCQTFWKYQHVPLILLDEIVRTYYTLNTQKFTSEECSRICTVLNIMQRILYCKDIRNSMFETHMPFYLYPFLNLSDNTQKYECLRIASLGVIGSLLQDDSEVAVNYLKNTELIPLTLRIMDIGSEVSKVVATHIFLKIINNKEGLEYACQTFERFVAISVILNSMVYQCISIPSIRLLKGVLECYIRLTFKGNVKVSLFSKKPEALMHTEIQKQIDSNPECKELFNRFMDIIASGK
ncbi:Rcd1-like cell differentiation protein [Hamiltosporidium tvaerminnensis]|uniref:Rcd1-like cell differentiation protein n=6 Tax=Hamiltosporidium TaxID=1176354 RepID=A0A4Q9LAF7_9MICR|nr:Cell differentiation protein RCD1 [Hamiltosporidium tvaerminnensis]TBU01817.1 Rcd1-like cell differentiation protein [Hamiltosporidium tvaerminnensis]TBU04777.1 Rcd1-like cell differentiation protein [Hamiltosporidium magnivora]